MADPPLKPVWDGEHTNTYEVDLGTWVASVEFDHEPTDEELVTEVTDRIGESLVDFVRHANFAISELTLIEVEKI